MGSKIGDNFMDLKDGLKICEKTSLKNQTFLSRFK